MRTQRLGVDFAFEPHFSPAPGRWEAWLRDPGGYFVLIAGPDGGAA